MNRIHDTEERVEALAINGCLTSVWMLGTDIHNNVKTDGNVEETFNPGDGNSLQPTTRVWL